MLKLIISSIKKSIPKRYKIKVHNIIFNMRRISYFSEIIVPEEMVLIAHAGGGIDGINYTNSLESFIENYDKGFRVFEFDFLLTSDNKIVARHDWLETMEQTDSSNNLPLSYNEFISNKIYGSYTPLDFKSVIELMKIYGDIDVIIDSKTTSSKDSIVFYEKITTELVGVDKSIIKRLMPQIFYQEDIKVINRKGFGDVIYVVGREKISNNNLKVFCNLHNIKILSISKGIINIKLVQDFLHEGIMIFSYTVNDDSEFASYKKIGVKGVFTDFISPKND